jgi:hypothetical protein
MPTVNHFFYPLLPPLACPVKLALPMISLPSPPTLLAGICLSTSAICLAQAPASMDEPVRVTVSLNNDGSRTVYQFDNAKHQATATTSEADGKARRKIIY